MSLRTIEPESIVSANSTIPAFVNKRYYTANFNICQPPKKHFFSFLGFSCTETKQSVSTMIRSSPTFSILSQGISVIFGFEKRGILFPSHTKTERIFPLSVSIFISEGKPIIFPLRQFATCFSQKRVNVVIFKKSTPKKCFQAIFMPLKRINVFFAKK